MLARDFAALLAPVKPGARTLVQDALPTRRFDEVAHTAKAKSLRIARGPREKAPHTQPRRESVKHRAELARLRRQREAYVAMSADEPDPEDLKTVSSAWRTGDYAQRWEVLGSLFERIHIRQDRKVEGYTPRSDRANRGC